MKFKFIIFEFACFFLISLFAQQSSDLTKLEKKANSLYYQLTEPRGEESYLNEKILWVHQDTKSQA